MRFSRKTDYDIILVQSLQGTFQSGEYISLSRVSREHKLPFAFIEKLAEILRKNGFLEARRGPDGGYRLLKDPRTITLKELIDTFEESRMMRCMKSPHPEKYCPFVEACPTRAGWLRIEKKVNKIFETATLDTL
jgi:Rrf2 family protein